MDGDDIAGADEQGEGEGEWFGGVGGGERGGEGGGGGGERGGEGGGAVLDEVENVGVVVLAQREGEDGE